MKDVINECLRVTITSSVPKGQGSSEAFNPCSSRDRNALGTNNLKLFTECFLSQVISSAFTEDTPHLTELDSLGKRGILVIYCCIINRKLSGLKL